MAGLRLPRRVTQPRATNDLLGTFADGGAQEARSAVAAARRAFDSTAWSRDRHRRAAALHELADRLGHRKDELITLPARENGKLLAEAALEVEGTIPKLRYHAALSLTDYGRAGEMRPGMYSMTLCEAAGVAAVIVPWNSPVILPARSFALTLAAGCTVVMKMPAQTGPVNGVLSEIIADTSSLEPGVFNVFTESGNAGAPEFVSSPDVDVVSYTGSTAVGRVIMEQATPTLKTLPMEPGIPPRESFAPGSAAAAVSCRQTRPHPVHLSRRTRTSSVVGR
ncbi:aldehyde dehydrogenase family protein [Streptomyces sp. JH002]|uniref:aldehyde dehydrogenase family protein n=1 Tax=Streptomyces sp. JH002 TaxID=2763259 RepID=UPI003D803CE7